METPAVLLMVPDMGVLLNKSSPGLLFLTYPVTGWSEANALVSVTTPLAFVRSLIMTVPWLSGPPVSATKYTLALSTTVLSLAFRAVTVVVTWPLTIVTVAPALSNVVPAGAFISIKPVVAVTRNAAFAPVV